MDKKRKLVSALTTLLTCVCIVVVLLFFFGFKTPLPLPEEEGVVIETLAGGGGGGSGEYVEPVEDVESMENYITEDNEDVDYHATPQKTTPKENPKVDSRLTNYKFGNGNGNGTGIGNGTGTGSGNGNGDGIGDGDGDKTGPGKGIDLAGRFAKSLPTPSYNDDEQGKVVVKIWVDRDGKVTQAKPGEIGTTISSVELWKECKSAALKAKFSAKPNAPEIQIGTITYFFYQLN